MNKYEEQVIYELDFWKMELKKKPSMLSNLTTKFQAKLNSYIPNKVHHAITATIKQMVKAVLLGSKYTTSTIPSQDLTLLHREALVKAKIDSYSTVSYTHLDVYKRQDQVVHCEAKRSRIVEIDCNGSCAWRSIYRDKVTGASQLCRRIRAR